MGGNRHMSGICGEGTPPLKHRHSHLQPRKHTYTHTTARGRTGRLRYHHSALVYILTMLPPERRSVVSPRAAVDNPANEPASPATLAAMGRYA